LVDIILFVSIVQAKLRDSASVRALSLTNGVQQYLQKVPFLWFVSLGIQLRSISRFHLNNKKGMSKEMNRKLFWNSIFLIGVQ